MVVMCPIHNVVMEKIETNISGCNLLPTMPPGWVREELEGTVKFVCQFGCELICNLKYYQGED